VLLPHNPLQLQLHQQQWVGLLRQWFKHRPQQEQGHQQLLLEAAAALCSSRQQCHQQCRCQAQTAQGLQQQHH
jgi:hypothetical protein